MPLKRWSSVFGLALAALLLAGGGLAAYMWARSGPVLLWPRERFTPGAWAKTGEADRYVFYRDLAGRKLLLGKSRDETLRMLGPSNTARAEADYLTYVIKYRGSGEYTFDAITPSFTFSWGQTAGWSGFSYAATEEGTHALRRTTALA